jgi:hypothetical protein
MSDTGARSAFSFRQFCAALRKPPAYVRALQSQIGIHVPAKGENYSPSYVRFMEQVVALRTFNVPVRDIVDLFTTEVRILEMLRFHTLNPSKTWYLDFLNGGRRSENSLLLTGYELGFPLAGGAIQSNLDFGDADKELFSGKEMGEDVRRALALYHSRLGEIRARVHMETEVLRQALAWSREAFGTPEP